MESIYLDKLLEYPLDKSEYKVLDQAWEFLSVFKKPYIHVTDYRNYLVKKIKKKYTLDEFYMYETILNKLFWNLRDKLEKNHKSCKSLEYNDVVDLDKKLKQVVEYLGTYYRSFINKLIIVDKNNKKIYYKKMEGSSVILDHDNFNLLALTILFDRQLYEDIMSHPIDYEKLKNMSLPKYYYQLDYGFPNLNCCRYSIGTKEDRVDRIQKFYYSGKQDYWYKLIL